MTEARDVIEETISGRVPADNRYSVSELADAIVAELADAGWRIVAQPTEGDDE